MQIGPHLYPPDALTKAFDYIWMELRAHGLSSYTGPNDPDVLRDIVAEKLSMAPNLSDAGIIEIAKMILSTFGIT